MSKKSKEKTKRICNACTKYEIDPFWGHQACSHHRPCAQGTAWDPFHCNKQVSVLESIEDNEQKTRFFTDMYKMLVYTRKHKKITDQPHWAYEEPIKAFFWNITVPALSETAQMTPTNNDQNIEQSLENPGSDLQSSVRSILSD